MGQILIRNIDERTLARFERRARSAGKTPEDLIREMISELERVPAGKIQREDVIARIDAIRARSKPGPSIDLEERRKERDDRHPVAGIDF